MAEFGTNDLFLREQAIRRPVRTTRLELEIESLHRLMRGLSKDLCERFVSVQWTGLSSSLLSVAAIRDHAVAESRLSTCSTGAIGCSSPEIALCAAALRSAKASAMHDFMKPTSDINRGSTINPKNRS